MPGRAKHIHRFYWQLKLAFEGFHMHDWKRVNAIIVPAAATDPEEPAVPAVTANDPKLILPIPQHDININPELQQNPGSYVMS